MRYVTDEQRRQRSKEPARLRHLFRYRPLASLPDPEGIKAISRAVERAREIVQMIARIRSPRPEAPYLHADRSPIVPLVLRVPSACPLSFSCQDFRKRLPLTAGLRIWKSAIRQTGSLRYGCIHSCRRRCASRSKCSTPEPSERRRGEHLSFIIHPFPCRRSRSFCPTSDEPSRPDVGGTRF